MGKLYTVKLTEKQLGNLIWASSVCEMSYDGFTDEEMGEAKDWLRSLRQAVAKLQATQED